MGIAVHAGFPLGYYQGRTAAGIPEEWPSPLRLYSAFVDAVYALLPDAEDLGVTAASLMEALKWFEGRAPDGVVLPECRLSSPGPRAYRELGIVSTANKQTRPGKKSSVPARRISALGGDVVYWWDEQPPESLHRPLDLICAEVPYLGERDSVVAIWKSITDHSPSLTHYRTQRSFSSTKRSRILHYAGTGRLDGLHRAFLLATEGKAPTTSQDHWKTSESEIVPENVTEGAESAIYAPPRPVSSSPWDAAFVVETHREGTAGENVAVGGWSPKEDERVAWSVALHRALVKQIGWDVPQVVTGKYADGLADRPANNLMIQILPAEWSPLVQEKSSATFLVVALPRGTRLDEVAAVAQALGAVRSIYAGRLGKLNVDSIHRVSASDFWKPPAAGFERWWMPYPLVMTETRPQGSREDGGKRWGIAEALALAVGFVWRDSLPELSPTASQRYWRAVEQVRDLGLQIRHTSRVADRNLSKYVHRRRPGSLLTGVGGLLQLGELGSDTQLAAIGQSRHLGTGLLLPVDFPVGSISGVAKDDFHHD